MAPTRPAIELGRDPGPFTNGSSFVEVSLSERYTPVRFPYSCLVRPPTLLGALRGNRERACVPVGGSITQKSEAERQPVQIDPVSLSSRRSTSTTLSAPP